MDFEFDPWERLTSEVVDGNADSCIAVDGRKWLVWQGATLCYVRPLNRPSGQWNYLVRPLLKVLRLTHHSVPETPLAEILAGRSYRELALARVWKLSEKAIVGWGSVGELKLFGSLGDCECDRNGLMFELSGPLAVGNARSSTVYERLRADWETPASQLSVLAHYADLTEAERLICFVRTRAGEPQQFVDLIRHILRAFPQNWPRESETLILDFEVGHRQLGFYRAVIPDEIGTEARAVIERAVRWFRPRLRTDKSTLPHHLSSYHNGLRIAATLPSHHEQLEAALQLRAWLETEQTSYKSASE